MAGVDSYVKILTHFNGTNGSTNVINESNDIVPSDSTEYNFNQYVYMDGNGDYLSIPSNSDFAFGTGDFTIDFRIYPLASNGDYALFDMRDGVSAVPLIFYDAGRLKYYTNNNFQIDGGANSLLTNQWSHIALVRSGTSTKLYVNGTQVGSTYSDSTNYVQAKIWIGRNIPYGASYPNCFMDEIRVSKGIARWTSNFTTPTTEYTSDSYTKLLLHCNGSEGSTTITDSSSSAHAVTANGDAKIRISHTYYIYANTALTTSLKKFGSAGCSFDGSGYIKFLDTSASLDIGNQDYTVDFWYRPTTLPAGEGPYLVDARVSQYNEDRPTLYINDKKVIFYYAYSNRIVTTTQLSDATWYHIALVRYNGNIKVYINGTSEGGTYSHDVTYSSIFNVYLLGRFSGGSVGGTVDEFRYSVGIARWTEDFTPPTEEYSSLSTPTVTTTSPVTLITTSTAYVEGNVSSDGGSTVTERGFVYSTSENPAISDIKVTVSGTTGEMDVGLINLTEGTTYHIRAFATNSVGTSYGADVSFATLDITTPTVTTTSPVTNIVGSTADVSGNVSSDGYATITERGFVYATTSNPTTANSKITVSGTTGAMTATITGLSPDTVYHVRAYAINSQGTSYGADVSWTSQIRQGVFLEILEYQSTETAEATTSTSQIKITAHGLSTHDMIVNTSCRTQDAERGARLVGATGLTADIIPLDDVISTQSAGDSVRLYKFIDRTDLVRIKSFRMTRRTGGKTEASFVLVTDSNYIPRSGQYVRINWNVSETSTRKFLGVIKSVRMVAASEAYGVDKLFLTVSCVGLNQVPSRRTIQVVEKPSYKTAEATTSTTNIKITGHGLTVNTKIYNVTRDEYRTAAVADADNLTVTAITGQVAGDLIDINAKTYGDIVSEMVDEYLYQDGIRKSTIDAGEYLVDEWVSDVISISEVLDECASKCGFQWFINDEGLLNFYADPASIPDSTEDIVDAGTFTDFSNLEFEESLDNYMNKMFIAGGRDTLNDNEIIIGSEDFSESTAMQNITAGTGVYGTVQRDAGLVESNPKTAEAGTTTTNIKVTAHGQETGYMVWNSTRSAYRQITRVDADNFSVSEISAQTTGDQIVFFDQANKLIANEFKIRGFMPKKFSFVTREMVFEPGSKIQVDLARYGISTEYYVIDDVEIYDEGGTVQTFRCRVSCSLRDNSNFTTQRLPNFYNYFGGF